MSENNLDDLRAELEQSSIKKKKSKTKFYIVLGSIAALVLVVATGVFLSASRFTTPEELPKETVVISNQDTAKSENTTILRGSSGIDLEAWEQSSHKTESEALKLSRIKSTETNFMGWTLNGFPSERDGFTSDPRQKLNNLGMPNIYFVEVTREGLLDQVSALVERITNPIFGDWINYQYATEGSKTLEDMLETQTEVLSDVITSEFAQELKTEKQLLMFDWNMNLFGLSDKEFKGITKSRASDDTLGVALVVGKIVDGQITSISDKELKLIMTVDYKHNEEKLYKTIYYNLDLVIYDGKVAIAGGAWNEEVN